MAVRDNLVRLCRGSFKLRVSVRSHSMSPKSRYFSHCTHSVPGLEYRIPSHFTIPAAVTTATPRVQQGHADHCGLWGVRDLFVGRETERNCTSQAERVYVCVVRFTCFPFLCFI
jgi:hypothetical protein